ncbi:homoserine kinase [Altericroceibacterium xinjiangense]|uniref:homoserine kinase n=1 Tax=Altericroceibacterium xinjiangense TaxID=762261 RepID=UPI000F7E62C4|nr:homoserine kinase [Altericroceibacterium xinjiangense]
MAVYTQLGSNQLTDLIAQYEVGQLISAKGIAEGVSNSNWLIETTGTDGKGARFILTMYERRIDLSELPFFLSLLDHLAVRPCPVPRTIHDRNGAAFRFLDGKAVALIEFLPGVSIDDPGPEHVRAVGEALAGIHLASADFEGERENGLGPAAWRTLIGDCGKEGLAQIDPALVSLTEQALDAIDARWPVGLPRSIIHADLFPDNVLLLDNRVSGLIDFYFACRDTTAYDLAVTHAAWCFDPDGRNFRHDLAAALVEGYQEVRPLSQEEREAMPVLAEGAAMRFLATRAYDWLHTPADALVTRKDPMAFARRLQFYSEAGHAAFPSLA